MNALPSILDICVPREDILAGSTPDSAFAADLAMVLNGTAPADYADPARFLAATHPTRGLRALLRNVCLRLSGSTEQIGAIFRLDTNYGGGKTHALIALAHAARGMRGLPGAAEFVDPAILPDAAVRVAAFDGENADPANGRDMGGGLRAFTPWGELAHALGGPEGYESIRASDTGRVAPGAGNIAALIGERPALILLDEIAVWLRKHAAADADAARGQFTAFLTALFRAVETSPRAALVFTLAVGKDGRARDAYADENRAVADLMRELNSISARKADILDPTEENETADVLRRRIFARVDADAAAEAVSAYARLWSGNADRLASAPSGPDAADAFRASYPFHPDLIDVLREKTATLENFQRVRGMLRILARTVHRLWFRRPENLHAIHIHHVDLPFSAIRQEFLTKLGLDRYAPALAADVAAAEGASPSLAERMDAASPGMPPLASHVARTVFIHSLAYNDALQGASDGVIRRAVLAPGVNPALLDEAIRRFKEESAYLDDSPGRPLRFQVEPNLNQIIRRHEDAVDPDDIRALIRSRTPGIFQNGPFRLVAFPALPNEVEDSRTDRPLLVLMAHEACAIPPDSPPAVPDLIRAIFERKGEGTPRINRNNLVFLAADAGRTENMRRAARVFLALEDMRRPEAQAGLAPHQKEDLKLRHRRAEQNLAVAIQQAWRHVIHPSGRRSLPDESLPLAHAAIDIPASSASPGGGQEAVADLLRGAGRIAAPGVPAASPDMLIGRTPLKDGPIRLADLRDEFRRNPALPMLTEDAPLALAVWDGVDNGAFVLRDGSLVCGQGEPHIALSFAGEAVLLTNSQARDAGIWPPKPPTPEPPKPNPGTDTGSGAGTGPGSGSGSGAGSGPGTPPPDSEITAEGAPLAALDAIRKGMAEAGMTAAAGVTLRFFSESAGLAAVALLRSPRSLECASRRLELTAGFDGPSGATCQVEFNGPIQDFDPLRDFLRPQLQAARAAGRPADFEANITLEFDPPLPAPLDALAGILEKCPAADPVVLAARRAASGERP